ncbi:MAG TPA: SRPBCC family protein [Acidimicrobiales bacterium]|jgi:uncharacterized membrane protein|nr:SRPBCC family protein [Acidimicrobiales bacterium]
MITRMEKEIAAPAAVVWQVFSDVENWPEWTASVTDLTALDGRALRPGARFEIRQPKFPKLVWTVTEVEPGTSWTWVSRSPGAVTTATHVVRAAGPDRTVVEQVLDQGGFLGGVVARLMVGTTRRYLEMEAAGLKARSEERRRDDATAP